MPGIMRALNNISRCQAIYRKKAVDLEDLCTSHYAFVPAVSHNPGLSQEELARELCLDKSTVARALANLEKNGYITRVSNEKDRRQTLVYPTQKMLEICPRVRQVNRAWAERLTAGISPQELEMFYQVLARMEKSAKAIVEEWEENK